MLNIFFDQRANDLRILMKASSSLFANTHVLKASYRRAYFSIFFYTLCLGGALLFAIGSGWGFLILLFIVFFLFPYSLIYHARMRAVQCWLTFKTLTNKPSTFIDAVDAMNELKWSLRIFALADFLLRFRKGKLTFFLEIAHSFLKSFAGFSLDYLLPSMVIEKGSLAACKEKIADLIKNVPKDLEEAFRFEIFKGNIFYELRYISFLIILASVGVSYQITPYMDPMFRTSLNSGGPGNIEYSFVPLFCGVALVFLMWNLLNIFVSTLKDIYSTCFYVAINHPSEIKESLRGDLTTYLKLSEKMHATTQDERIGSSNTMPYYKVPNSRSNNMSEEDTISTLQRSFEDHLKTGHSLEEIALHYIERGYPANLVEKVKTQFK